MSDYNRSSGFFGDILRIAVGAAIANRITEKMDRRDEKKDLMGSAGCQYGKKDENGFTLACPGCVLRPFCSR
ncbi:MAG: hypothetical protein IKD89_02850 [Clostridia bacterium]|nr:hypothetical protein [Clostridia bacterium]